MNSVNIINALFLEIRCPPQFITNGTAVNTGGLFIGDNVTVNCNTGFEISGINPYKCGIDIAPTCQSKYDKISVHSTCFIFICSLVFGHDMCKTRMGLMSFIA